MGSQSLGDLGSRWTAPWAHSPIDVFVMLPLSMVDADGVFRAAPWFGTALSVLAASGVRGVAVDVWWGLVEREPQCYCWAGYEQLFDLIKGKGLQIQVVMSFHACGGNVGDTAQIPLPAWVLQCGEHDPDLFFTDRPREGAGRRNREYLSIWADEAAALRGRTPLQCYEDFMQAFCNNFHQLLGSSLVDIVVGAGPCGELRYPAYVESNGWKFPGVGEFQCYDRRALACLAQAAREAGHPEWGYGGPHNAGDYASWPEDTDFFRVGGAWETEYGRFFLGWYSACLLRHADQLLAIAKRVLLRAMTPPTPPEAPPGTHCPPSLPPNTLSLPPPPGAPPPPLQFTQVQPEQPHHSIATPGCGIAGNGPPAPPPLPHTTLPLLALDLSILHPPPGPEGLRATTSPLGLLSSSSSSISRGLSCNSAGVAGAESDFAQLSTRSLPLLPSALLPGHPTPAPSTTPLRSPPRHRTHSQLRSPPPSSQFQHSSADLLALTSHSLTAACSEPGGGEGEESGAGEEGEEEYGQAALGLLQGAQALSQRLALVAKAEELGSPAAAAAAAAHPAQLSTASAASSRYASSNGRPGGWVAASAGTSPHSLPQIMIPALARMPQHQHQQQPQQQQGHCPPPSHTAAHAAPPAALQQQEQQRQVARSAADPPPPLTAPLAASSIRSGARGEQQASPSPSPPFPPPVLLPVASPDQAAGSSSGSSSAGLARPHLPSPLQRISCASGGQQQQQQPTPGGTLLPREPPPPPPWGSQQQPTCTTPPAAPPGAGGSMGGSSGSSSGGAAPGSGVSSSLPPGCVGGVQGYQGVPADCGQGSGSCLPLTDSAADMMALGGRRGGSGHPCLHQGPPPPPLAPALPELPGQAQQQQQQQQQAPGPRQAGAGQQPSPQAEWSDPEGVRPEPAASHHGTRGVTGGSLGPVAGAPASATPGGGWGQDSWAGGAGGGTQPDTAQGPGPPPQLLPSQAASSPPPSLYPNPGTQHQGCLTPPLSAPLPPHLTLMRPAASLPAPAHPSWSAPQPHHPAAPSPLLPHHAATTGGVRPGLASSVQTHSAGHPGGSAAACLDSAVSRGPALWQHAPGLGLKIAGIHWWYRTRSHAAELTAGYYNTATHDGYAAILQVCARHSARLTLTCVEMCDAQHAQHAQCGPEGLLKQIRLLAARYAVPLAGENALPIFLAGGVDAVALDRIVFNTRAWYGPSSAAAAARHYLHQQQLRAQQEQEQQQQQQHDRAQHQEQQHDTGQQQEQQQQQRGLQQNGGWVGALGAAAVVAGEHDSPQVLGWGYPEAGWGNGPPSSSSTAPPARYPTTHPPAGASACTWLPSLATQSALDPPPGRPAGLRAWGSLPPGGALHCPLPPQPTPQPQGLSSSSHAQGASGEGHSSSQQVSPPGGQASQGGRGLSRQPVLGRLRHVPTAASLTAIIGLAEGAAGLGGGGVAGGGAGPQGGGWSLSAAAVATGGTSTQQQQQQQLRAQQPTTLRQAQEALGRLEARQGGAAASTASSPGPSPASCTPPWSSYHTSGSSPSPAAAAAADYLAGVPPPPPPLMRVSPPPPNNTSLPPALHALAEGQGWWEESCPPLPPPPGLPCSASSRGLLSGWGGGEGGRPSPPTRPTSAQSEPFSHHALPPGRWGWPPHSASTGQQGGAMPPAPSAAWCALGHGWGSGGEKGDLGLGRPGEQSARVAASGLRSDSYADIVEPLPSLASFTLLRLGPELLLPSHQPPWLRFMTRMQQGGYVPC